MSDCRFRTQIFTTENSESVSGIVMNVRYIVCLYTVHIIYLHKVTLNKIWDKKAMKSWNLKIVYIYICSQKKVKSRWEEWRGWASRASRERNWRKQKRRERELFYSVVPRSSNFYFFSFSQFNQLFRNKNTS